jgi:peptide/nickel transport system substrate-binding protein
MSLITKLREVLESFSPLQLLGILGLFIVLVVSLFLGVFGLQSRFSVEIPSYGGTVREGIIGSPRLINPLLAVSQSDLDLTSLIYSGLLRPDADGNMLPDLAEGYTISEDKLTYTVTLKEGLTFHDGEPLTAEDVVYTVALVQDQELNSVKKIEWEGVFVSQKDERTVVFTLKKPYPRFLHILSLGILPKHIWKNLPIEAVQLSDYNLFPIGSGPYKIVDIEKKSGIQKKYTLRAFDNFADGKPFIETFVVEIYQTEDELKQDLEKGVITNASSLSPYTASFFKGSSKLTTRLNDLPRIYGVFWNQDKNKIFLSASVRSALLSSIDTKKIITTALYGFGEPAPSLVPSMYFEQSSQDTFSIEKSRALLEADGWKRNATTTIYEKVIDGKNTELAFTLVTIEGIPEFEKTAETLKATWQELGVRVTLEAYELGDLNQRIIKDRTYDALLYGTIVQNEEDLYAFWHSSQRKSPGLNLSQYANTKVDNALEKIRSGETKNISETYTDLIKEFTTDSPAALIYTPKFIYITDEKLQTPDFNGRIVNAHDRFTGVHKWYIYTEKIWSILQNIPILQRIHSTIH